MVRLRRDRWYSMEGQQKLRRRVKAESSMYGRLVSLIVMVVLVLMLMQRVSDPQIIGQAFRQLGVPLGESPAINSVVEKADLRTEDPPDGSSESWEEWSADIWASLLDPASSEVLHDLTYKLYSSEKPAGGRSPGWTEWMESIDAKLSQWGSMELSDLIVPNETSPLATTWLWRINRDWQEIRNRLSSQPVEWSQLSPEIRFGFERGLDRTLLDRIQDDSFWRKEERIALIRAFQLSEESIRSGTQSSLPLIDAAAFNGPTSALRGDWIRIRGNVVQAPVSGTVTVEGFHSVDYLLFWVRPNDGTDQPICMYFSQKALGNLDAAESQLPFNESFDPNGGASLAPDHSEEKIHSQNKEARQEKYPIRSRDALQVGTSMLEFDAMLVKRLAYRSRRGIDVAPVLLIRDFRVADLSNRPLAGRTTLGNGNRSGWRKPSPHISSIPLLSDRLSEPLKRLTEHRWDGSIQSEFDRHPELMQSTLQVLYQLRRFPLALETAAMRRRKLAGAECRTIEPVVIGCIPRKLDPVQSEWFGSEVIYELKLESDEEASREHEQILWVTEVPKEWLRQDGSQLESIRQPAQLHLLTLSAFDNTSDEANSKSGPTLNFSPTVFWSWAGRRTEEPWIPEVGGLKRQLGALGWDLTQAGVIAGLQKQSMLPKESRPFFRLIDLASRLEVPLFPKPSKQDRTGSSIGNDLPPDMAAAELATTQMDASRPEAKGMKLLGLEELLTHPEPSSLHWTRLGMRVTRITRVSVTEEASVEWLGGNEYYELDGFVPLDQMKIRLEVGPGDGTRDHSPVVFEDEFPVTVVVKQIPNWLMENSKWDDRTPIEASPFMGRGNDSMGRQEAGNRQASWHLSEGIELTGIFYRFWSYSSQRVVPSGNTDTVAGYRQIGPLVVGVEIARLPGADTKSIRQQVDRIGTIFLLGMLAVALVVWRVTRVKTRR